MQFEPVDDWFLLRQIPNKANEEPISRHAMESIVKRIIELNKSYKIKPKIANAVPFCVTDKDTAASVCVGGRNDSGHSRLFLSADGIFSGYGSGFVLGQAGDSRKKIWLSEKMKEIRNLDYLNCVCKRCEYKIQCRAGLSNIKHQDHLIPI
jgi:hypothetical protein